MSERLEDAEAAAIPGRQMEQACRGEKAACRAGSEMKLMLKESLEKSLGSEKKSGCTNTRKKRGKR